MSYKLLLDRLFVLFWNHWLYQWSLRKHAIIMNYFDNYHIHCLYHRVHKAMVVLIYNCLCSVMPSVLHHPSLFDILTFFFVTNPGSRFFAWLSTHACSCHWYSKKGVLQLSSYNSLQLSYDIFGTRMSWDHLYFKIINKCPLSQACSTWSNGGSCTVTWHAVTSCSLPPL